MHVVDFVGVGIGGDDATVSGSLSPDNKFSFIIQ